MKSLYLMAVDLEASLGMFRLRIGFPCRVHDLPGCCGDDAVKPIWTGARRFQLSPG